MAIEAKKDVTLTVETYDTAQDGCELCLASAVNTIIWTVSGASGVSLSACAFCLEMVQLLIGRSALRGNSKASATFPGFENITGPQRCGICTKTTADTEIFDVMGGLGTCESCIIALNQTADWLEKRKRGGNENK